MQLEIFKNNNTYCLYDESEITNFTPDMLCAQYWQDKNAITGSAQGRGTTWFIQHMRMKARSTRKALGITSLLSWRINW